MKECLISQLTVSLNRLQKKYLPRRRRTSAAQACSENKPVIAAVNRCATQNQVQRRFFTQAVKRYLDTKLIGGRRGETGL
jgi:hypothetical protein